MTTPVESVAKRHINSSRPSSTDHSDKFFFDCETTGVTENSKITCAAVTGGENDVYVWHSGQGESLSKQAGNKLVDFLISCGADKVFTFNGGAFDLKMLFLLTGRVELKEFALNHKDLMLTFVCENRYYSSMDSFAKATLGHENGKTNSGAWAATAWFTDEASEVINYCVSDTMVLGKLVEYVGKWGKLSRTAKSGRLNHWILASMNGVIPSVQESLANPSDASWMKDPPSLPDLAWASATCR